MEQDNEKADDNDAGIDQVPLLHRFMKRTPAEAEDDRRLAHDHHARPLALRRGVVNFGLQEGVLFEPGRRRQRPVRP